MQFLYQFKSLLRNVVRKHRVEQDLDEEVHCYLDMTIEERISHGASPAEALRKARIELGGIEQLKEEVRGVRLGTTLETFWQDLRFACRTLLKTPGVTLAVILSLSLGIGANTGIFSIVNALLMKSLPVEQPEQLVLFGDGSSRGFVSAPSGRWNIFSYPLYQELRNRQASFEQVAAFRTQLDRLNVRPGGSAGGDNAQLAWGRLVSGNYFAVLRVKTVLGRTLLPQDEQLSATPAGVLSHEYWTRRFGRSPSIIGQVMNMNGVLVNIVGVAPAEFFGESVESELADVWLPLTLQPRIMSRVSALDDPEINWLNLIARLRPNVILTEAQAGVNVTFKQFLAQRTGSIVSNDRQEELRRSHIVLTPGGAGVSGLRTRYSRPLHILLAVVGLVLLIACANVANLLLARGAAREKEISMRLALGAGRRRVLRQLLTESLLLACLGGALGVLLSLWMVRILVANITPGDQRVPLDVSPDFKVLGFTLGVCLLTGILFGMAPSLRAARIDVWPALKGVTPVVRERLRWGLAQWLIVGQIGLCVPLLAGAALFVQTLRQLHSQDFGFSPDKVLEVGIDPSIAGYRPDQLEALYRNLLDRVNGVSGVRVASLSLYSPMSGNNWSGGIVVEGYTPLPKQSAFSQWVWVGPRYIETAGITLLSGRDLGDQDTESSRKVAVVNQSFADRYLNGRNPIGRHFSLLKADVEIVGVVKDFKFNDPRQDFRPVAFMPLVQSSFSPARYARFLEVRTVEDPASMAAAVREIVKQVDPNLPVTGFKTLSRQIDETLVRERLIAGLSTFFAILALLLACIGLYGVFAYAVTRRTREIGIRMAIGALHFNILTMILREVLLLALVGAGIGSLAALAMAGAISSQLYGLKATDPRIITGAALLLVGTAIFAGFLPAQRASRMDPMRTLRAE